MKNKAIILLGHGSRVPEAGEDMQQIAAQLKEKYGYQMVETCFMSRLGPHFPEIFEKCVMQGANEVILIPYFLHTGLHMRLDIPKMMQECGSRFPQVKLIFGKHLGYDESLVDIVEKRIAESIKLCDVRELSLPPEEKYPIPQGQDEFVPMPPEEAARWRKMEEKR